MGVYGAKGNYQIRSVWLWRGDQIPIFWKNHPDYVYHKFQRLSSTSETDKSIVEIYWSSDKEGSIVDGLPTLSVEYFG